MGEGQMGRGRLEFDAREVLAVALRLAMGAPRPGDAGANWSLVFDAAGRELLAPLAWHRSGPFIRRHADAEVSALWRRTAMAAQMRGERQRDLLCEVTSAMDAADVCVVVLKGLPLGERLYGDPFVRPSADVDLYVAAPDRGRAASILGRLGWRRTDGAAPWHESWSRRIGTLDYHLELHSMLVSDHLAHIATPSPAARMMTMGSVRLRGHTGDLLAPYLAVHLATHQLPPLLWLVDFASLWRSLSAADRVRADGAARATGLARYLTWACERAALLERAATDDAAAFAALGIRRGGRRDVHSIWRHVVLASGFADRARVLGAFLVPHRVRGTVGSVVRYTVARLRTRLGALAGVSRRYGPVDSPERPGGNEQTAARPLRLEREELVTFTRDVVGAGAALWVRAPGGSMVPTIPRGALVRIGPVPSNGFAVGDVILALTDDGEPVLHRAVRIAADGVIARGDAAVVADPMVPLSRVIGLATHVRYGDAEHALTRRPRRSIAVSALKMRRRIARVLRRVG